MSDSAFVLIPQFIIYPRPETILFCVLFKPLGKKKNVYAPRAPAMTECFKYGASTQVCQNICFPVPGDACGRVVWGKGSLVRIA